MTAVSGFGWWLLVALLVVDLCVLLGFVGFWCFVVLVLVVLWFII